MSVKVTTSKRRVLPKGFSGWAHVALYLPLIAGSVLFISWALWHFIHHGELMLAPLLAGLVGLFLGTRFMIEQFTLPRDHRTPRARVRFSKRRRSGPLL